MWAGVGGHGHSLAQRYCTYINPWATPEQRTAGVCANWPEFFVRRIDPARGWIEGARGARSAIIDFERPFGVEADWRRDFPATGMLQAREYGLRHLVDGFAGCAKNYTDAGVEVVAHLGRFNSDGLADKMLAENRRSELFDLAHQLMQPLVWAGVRIGRDNMAEAAQDSLDHRHYLWLDALGVPQQIEATADLGRPHWKGAVTRIVVQLFQDRHVVQKPWGKNHWPTWSDAKFLEWYPDLRVNIAGGWPVTTAVRQQIGEPEFMRRTAQATRELLAASPNITVLLHLEHIEAAVKFGMGVEEFFL